jgi:hypothetical protein
MSSWQFIHRCFMLNKSVACICKRISDEIRLIVNGYLARYSLPFSKISQSSFVTIFPTLGS